MTWLRTDYDFGLRCKTLTLNVRELAACRLRDDLKEKGRDDPVKVEKLARELIRFYRPAIADSVVIVSMTFKGLNWEFLCCHNSFVPIGIMESPPQEGLIPDERRLGEQAFDWSGGHDVRMKPMFTEKEVRPLVNEEAFLRSEKGTFAAGDLPLPLIPSDFEFKPRTIILKQDRTQHFVEGPAKVHPLGRDYDLSINEVKQDPDLVVLAEPIE
jgi:hypothetical protein